MITAGFPVEFHLFKQWIQQERLHSVVNVKILPDPEFFKRFEGPFKGLRRLKLTDIEALFHAAC
jgi:hypothetical protein